MKKIKMHNMLNEKNNLPLILFMIILLNYIPLFLKNLFTKNSNTISMTVIAICFFVEIMTLIFFYINNKKHININKKKVFVLSGITIVLLIVQVKNFIINNFFVMDVFNIGCITINIFLLYILIFNYKVDEEKIMIFFKGIFYLGIAAVLWNIILFCQEILHNLNILELEDRQYLRNIKSFFPNRNSLAFYLFVSAISNVFLMIKYKDKKIYKYTLLFFIFGMWCSYSKTGFAIIIAFLELFFLLNNEYSWKRRLTICICLAVIGIVGLINIMEIKIPNLIDRVFENFKIEEIQNHNEKIEEVQNHNEKNDETALEKDVDEIEKIVVKVDVKRLSGRTDIWKMGFNVLNESYWNYLFGVGRFYSTENLILKNQKFTQYHNIYLDILLTGGIIQLLYVGYIYLSVLIKIIKSNMGVIYKKVYIIMLVLYAGYILMESCGRFSIGAVDTLCLIFFITIPLLHANSAEKIKEIGDGNKKNEVEE